MARGDVRKIEIYDTTLRDGSQLEGISLTVEDKLRNRGTARLARRALHRSRLAGREPEGRRAVQARPQRVEARDEHAGRVRVDAPGQGQGRQRRHAAASRRGERRHRVHRRQVVGLPRHRSARHDARRRCRDGRRLGRVPPPVGHGRAVRRRTLLRRLQAQPRVLAARARSRSDERRESSRAVRHERRRVAAPGRSGRRRGRPLLRWRREGRGAPPRRRGHGCGQRARRRAGRRDPGAGHDQRLRRAHRQLQSHDDHPEPHAEDGVRDDPARSVGAAHAGCAPHRRAREHAAQSAGRVRGSFRVRAQGRTAHERDREAPRRVRARLAGDRRQRNAVRRVRARGQVDARAQGQGARTAARRPAARRRGGDVEATRARGLPLRGRRRFARAVDAARDRVGSRTGSGSSRSASSPTTSSASTRSPTRPVPR